MNRILILDDVEDMATEIQEAIQHAFPEARCAIELDFRKSADVIKEFRPDAIVLDVMKGISSDELPGQKTWKDVWDTSFCPIVIYTGLDGPLHPPVPADHPFVKRIAKGGGTLQTVTNALKGFAPAVESVHRLKTEVDAVIHKVLRDTAGNGHIGMENPENLIHAGRRRIAATMDDSTITGNRTMKSWEQYLIPAIGESPLTADLLRKRVEPWDSATAYRLVLTPSCDLVKLRNETTLLVACCEGPLRLAQKLQLSLGPKKLERDSNAVITKALTAGVYFGFLPLPRFPLRVPLMVANLKGLEVIKWDSVGPIDSSTHEYVRVASIDSPFREQVAWAYLTTAARPGMPDRDLCTWAEEIVRECTPTSQPDLPR